MVLEIEMVRKLSQISVESRFLLKVNHSQDILHIMRIFLIKSIAKMGGKIHLLHLTMGNLHNLIHFCTLTQTHRQKHTHILIHHLFQDYLIIQIESYISQLDELL